MLVGSKIIDKADAIRIEVQILKRSAIKKAQGYSVLKYVQQLNVDSFKQKYYKHLKDRQLETNISSPIVDRDIIESSASRTEILMPCVACGCNEAKLRINWASNDSSIELPNYILHCHSCGYTKEFDFSERIVQNFL